MALRTLVTVSIVAHLHMTSVSATRTTAVAVQTTPAMTPALYSRAVTLDEEEDEEGTLEKACDSSRERHFDAFVEEGSVGHGTFFGGKAITICDICRPTICSFHLPPSPQEALQSRKGKDSSTVCPLGL